MNEDTVDIDRVSVRLADSHDSVRWNEYLDRSPNRTYGHRWEWREILVNSFGLRPYYLLAEQQGDVVGLLPATFLKSLLFGRFMISLPWLDYGGPIADDDDIAVRLVNEATSIASENRCRFLEMRAVHQNQPELVNKTDKYEFHLNLDGGTDVVWRSLDAKARNQTRKAEKAGLTASFGGSELLDDFYMIFARNMRDLGTPVWPKKLYSEIFRLLGKDAEICLISLDQAPVAGGILLHYEDFSAVPSASAYREYLKLCPNNLLYWSVIRHCIERGSKLFDFGRSSLKTGTYRFKKQWVKEPKEQCWQYSLLTVGSLPELNPANPKFKLAIKLWRRLPLPIANILGPKIVTKLP